MSLTQPASGLALVAVQLKEGSTISGIRVRDGPRRRNGAMKSETDSRTELPSQDEARAMIERARRLRAETLGRLVRAAWLRVAHRPAGRRSDGRADSMPLARA
jgi:hypothetical protein